MFDIIPQIDLVLINLIVEIELRLFGFSRI